MKNQVTGTGAMDFMEKTNEYVRIEDVCCRFGEKTVLDHISLSIEKGKIYGLLGPSGAGKTTLIRILTGQLRPNEGKVQVSTEFGNPVTGIMMDDFGLYERLSVWNNLKLFAGIYGVKDSRIKELLDKTGLTQAQKTSVDKLSKGMRSRVNLCRSFLRDMDILYLDEPTSGLDPATSEKIHELILEKQKEGVTVFLTTHNMFEAQKLCEKIFLLDQGKILEQGAPDEICRRYNVLDTIRVILKDGKELEFANRKESASPIADLIEKGELLSIHSSEPDLEKVFLQLTGRSLDQ